MPPPLFQNPKTERGSVAELSSVFSLNNFYGDFFIGESFDTPNVNVVPILAQFNIDGPDPLGFRHLTTHPSFIQILGSGKNNVSLNFGPFDFGITNVSNGSGISCTRLILFRINQFDCLTTRVTDMKVWAPDLSDFLIQEAFEIIFGVNQTSQGFPSGFQFGVETLKQDDFHLPRSLPDSQNLRRQDGAFTIHGSGDADVSEWMLLAVASSGTLPLGEYVGDPTGFVLRVTYDIDNLFPLFD